MSEDNLMRKITEEAEDRKAKRQADRERARADKLRGRMQNSVSENTNTNCSMKQSDNLNDIVEKLKDTEGKVKILKEELIKSENRLKDCEKERTTFLYQVDLLEENLIDIREKNLQTERICKNLETESKRNKRDKKDLELQIERLMKQIEKRDELIEKNNLVMIENSQHMNTSQENVALISSEAANILALGDGSLDDKIKRLAKDKDILEIEVRDLKMQLDQEKEKQTLNEKFNVPVETSMNGPEKETIMQQETQRQLTEYRFNIKKAEQEITTLQGTVNRLETQVKRFKTAAEEAEKNEEDLKHERRKLQRELRDTQSKLEESEREKANMSRRIDRLRNSRSNQLQS